ncbi:unnamed protein product [Notodromas monacha]|uniref:2-(3-amino-3-carboxypropyl)histidine synthase subunit 1 n=1 Tax=Notodromas monacha TaxID=399045 RepID=A0A7R9BTH6_9CRUS|nr:unnamed protein product [Notodromas monacha]CAG0921458.1 unnamed protein product [Notodromas monacha]
MTGFENVVQHVAKLLKEFEWIHGVVNTRLVCESVLEKLPEDWHEFLKLAAPGDLHEIAALSIPNNCPHSLAKFLDEAKMLVLWNSAAETVKPLRKIHGRKGISTKKLHEVQIISDFFVKNFLPDQILVFDIGSGKGYVDVALAKAGFEIMAFEFDESKRPSNLTDHPLIENRKFYLNADSSDEFLRIILEACRQRKKQACLLSLHGCGDLTPSILRNYVRLPDDIRGGLVVIPCCYHLVQTNTYEPMVEFGTFPRLGKPSLRLASQDSPLLWKIKEWSDAEHLQHAKSVIYRALLEFLAHKDGVSLVKSKGSDGANVKRSVYLDSFEKYFSSVSHKFRIHDALDESMKNLPESWPIDGQAHLDANSDLLQIVEGFTALQYCLQPVIESYILMDRVEYLRRSLTKEDIHAVKLFDDVISPRYGYSAENGGGEEADHPRSSFDKIGWLSFICAIFISKDFVNFALVQMDIVPKTEVVKKRIIRVPPSISENPLLIEACKVLPKNYNFEIPKTIWRIQSSECRRVGLQMPEGLLLFATTIADILIQFANVEVVIMGDVTYGACCVDDFTAKRVGVDFLVHYGHSCLVPIDVTSQSGVIVMYVFVDVAFDVSHAIECVVANLNPGSCVALASTVQFLTALHEVAEALKERGFDPRFLQSRPLSKGEVLGCTAANAAPEAESLLFLGDGRFHLEAAMIANPHLPAYKYDPYSKKFTIEKYDHQNMMETRKKSVEAVFFGHGTKVGIILGTLGRQGNPGVLRMLEQKAESIGCETTLFLMSEVFPDKLKLCSGIDVWVQVACPRLSIDWGEAFDKPILTPYEAAVALNMQTWKDVYPMDFYAAGSLGKWTPGHKCGKKEKTCGCDVQN